MVLGLQLACPGFDKESILVVNIEAGNCVELTDATCELKRDNCTDYLVLLHPLNELHRL